VSLVKFVSQLHNQIHQCAENCEGFKEFTALVFPD
jgi:hypothetical protein